MKNYKGTAKVKEDSTYVYKGATLEITGVYIDYKNGKGNGVYADGTREYKFKLEGTPFQEKYGKGTVIHDTHLEDIKLFETLVLPLTEEESIELIKFTRKNIWINAEKTLEAFIIANTKESVLPIPDLSTLYDEEEFNRRNNLK